VGYVGRIIAGVSRPAAEDGGGGVLVDRWDVDGDFGVFPTRPSLVGVVEYPSLCDGNVGIVSVFAVLESAR
jgi:hypothetical protein